MSNLKKVLALVLVLALSLTMFAGAIETVLPYDDLDELTAEQLDSLKLLYALGVIKGDDENSVNPTDTLTRGELCAILYRLYTGDAEEKYVSTYSNDCPYFDDVEDGKWYVPYVNWAYIKGVVAGYGNGKFGPTDNVDGVQAATMLARLVGYEIGSENWELVARRHAVELGLDDGVASKDLFGTDLSRGDMIVMVANVLDCYEVGTKVTLAEKIFDLEIIRGAILLGADKLGSTNYSVFAFKDEISGNVKYFITDLLSIEEDPTVDEIGQKYTLYVAKTTEVNGYKVLYAAYEEDENAYYHTVTGTVDDGKLNTVDADKDDYLLKLLDDNVVAYINGAVVATNKADAFAAFKASYGLKNSAAYKLIDNDGDGKYEYIFVERLTLGTMNTTEVVANVVAFNNITGAYTLSDGKEYVPGQYWGVNNDGEITGVVNAVDAVKAAVGTGTYTASSVQYKFTIENGKYIMKAEVCDETYFAGDYVLAMNSVGSSTYKGMRYVEFLTEDNTTLYAYVSKINHIDVRAWDGKNDNKNEAGVDGKAYDHQLYYINAYGDDTVELFTPAYVNSNYVNDQVDGKDPGTILVDTATSVIVLNAKPEVYTNVGIKLGENGGYVPAIDFNASYAYAQKIDGKYVPVLFSQSTYTGHFAKLAETATAKLKAAEDALAKVQDEYAKAQDLVSLAEDWAELKIKKMNGEANAQESADEVTLWVELTAGHEELFGNKFDNYFDNAPATSTTQVTNAVALFATNVANVYDSQIKDAEKVLAAVKAEVEPVSDIYYISAPAQDAVKMTISLEVKYNSDQYQIFKAYGTWYLQNYGDTTKDDYRVFFTVDGKTTEVEWNGEYYVVVSYVDGKKVLGAKFMTGEANSTVMESSIKTAIDSIVAAGTWDAEDGTEPGYVWGDAQSLNTSKGVVFAYGNYPFNFTASGNVYTWRAYNFDEFNVASFGNGGKDDDHVGYELADELIYTTSNGQKYVKAAKVTVKVNDVLPMGWMVENSKVFVYGNELGTITASGITVQSILPNGAYESIFVPFGYNFSYGDVIYAVAGEDGSYISYEKISNIYDVLKGNAGLQLLADGKSSFKGYAADGTVTIQGKLGITYTAKIDVAKTFFVGKDAKFMTSEKFADLVKAGNAFAIYSDANGYYYAVIL